MSAPLASRPILPGLDMATSASWVVVDLRGRVPGYVDAGRRDAVLLALPGRGRRLACANERFLVWTPTEGTGRRTVRPGG